MPTRLAAVVTAIIMAVVGTVGLAGTASAATTYTLLVSDSSDRSSPSALEGATIEETLYAFVDPSTDIERVAFYLDDQAMTGAPNNTEVTAPFDFNGGSETMAYGFDTGTIANGSHVITAVVTTTSGTTTFDTTFTVDNDTIPSPAEFDILFSESPERTDQMPLDGAVVDGQLYAFVKPDVLVQSVEYYIDDPTRSGTPVTVEATRPFDLGGGTTDMSNGYDTTSLTEGPHILTASITTASETTNIDVQFTVDNIEDPIEDPGIVPVTPARLADSRPDGTTVDGQSQAIGYRAAGSTTEIQVTGRGNVPDGTAAALLNVTAVRPDAQGFLTVYPCDEALPDASNVNYFANGIEPNAVLAKLSATGTVCIYTYAATHLVVDVNGHTG